MHHCTWVQAKFSSTFMKTITNQKKKTNDHHQQCKTHIWWTEKKNIKHYDYGWDVKWIREWDKKKTDCKNNDELCPFAMSMMIVALQMTYVFILSDFSSHFAHFADVECCCQSAYVVCYCCLLPHVDSGLEWTCFQVCEQRVDILKNHEIHV